MDDFGKKLELAIKKLSLSRAGLAAAVAVDKSVAGRWVSGKVRPSAHNLARISKVIAKDVPEFTMLDWDRDYRDFATCLGVSLDHGAGSSNTLWPLLPPKLSAEASHAALEHTAAYEGIWRTTRPSSDMPGEFLHDVSIVRRDHDGFLSFASGVEGTYYDGSAVMANQKLYYFCADDVFGTVSMGIINGVPRGRADVMDGVLITTLMDAGASPAASGIHLERLAVLTDDPKADIKKFRELVESQVMVAPPGSVSKTVAASLHGASNAPGMIRMLFNQSLTRGPMITPEFGTNDKFEHESANRSLR